MPEALGGSGWLTTTAVCVECNSFFGHSVDAVADAALLQWLRRRVGLPVHQDDIVEFVDPEIGVRRQARLAPDGTVQPLTKVVQVEDRLSIRADTEDEVLMIAEKIRSRRARRGQSVQYRALEPARPVAVRGNTPVQPVGEFNTLLGREAAKMAVEYIAVVTAPDLALVSELDAVRDHARSGTKWPGVAVAYAGPGPLVKLSEAGPVLALGLGTGPHPSQAEFDKMIDDLIPAPILDSDPDLGKIPLWPGFTHRLRLVSDGRRARFELSLFSCVVATVALPASLPLPWGCENTRDFISGAVTASHPWPSGGPSLLG